MLKVFVLIIIKEVCFVNYFIKVFVELIVTNLVVQSRIRVRVWVLYIIIEMPCL